MSEEQQKRIDELEEIHIFMHLFFVNNHPEFIPEFVELAYAEQEEPGIAKEAVASLHEAAYDLSTIKCTGDDFESWYS